MYINASTFISMARDNQKALEEKLTGGVRPNVIRPPFEAAFYPVWMLEPQDRNERLRRNLRIGREQLRQKELRFKLTLDMTNTEGAKEAQQDHDTNDEHFQGACYAAALMQMTAMSLFIQRTSQLTLAN